MFAQENRKNIESMNKNMDEQKTTVTFLRNQNQKKVRVETEKLNKYFIDMGTEKKIKKDHNIREKIKCFP